MPSEIVVAHADAQFLAATSSAIEALGHEVAVFDSSLTALDALENDGHARLLVTGVDFPQGQPNGVSLAAVAASHRPGLKVLFVGASKYQDYIEGRGELLPETTPPGEMARKVHDLLE